MTGTISMAYYFWTVVFRAEKYIDRVWEAIPKDLKNEVTFDLWPSFQGQNEVTDLKNIEKLIYLWMTCRYETHIWYKSSLGQEKKNCIIRFDLDLYFKVTIRPKPLKID